MLNNVKKETKQQTTSSQHHQDIHYGLITFHWRRHQHFLLCMHKLSAQFVYVFLYIVDPKQTVRATALCCVTEREFQWV